MPIIGCFRACTINRGTNQCQRSEMAFAVGSSHLWFFVGKVAGGPKNRIELYRQSAAKTVWAPEIRYATKVDTVSISPGRVSLGCMQVGKWGPFCGGVQFCPKLKAANGNYLTVGDLLEATPRCTSYALSYSPDGATTGSPTPPDPPHLTPSSPLQCANSPLPPFMLDTIPIPSSAVHPVPTTLAPPPSFGGGMHRYRLLPESHVQQLGLLSVCDALLP